MQKHFHKGSQIYFYIKNFIYFHYFIFNKCSTFAYYNNDSQFQNLYKTEDLYRLPTDISLVCSVYLFVYICNKTLCIKLQKCKVEAFSQVVSDLSYKSLIYLFYFTMILHYSHLQKMICIVYLSVPLFIKVSEA